MFQSSQTSKRLLLFVALITNVSILVSSCKKESVVPDLGEALIVSIGNNFFHTSDVRRIWIIMSDSKGNVIDTKEAFDGDNLEFRYPLSYADNYFFLTCVRSFTSGANQFCTMTSLQLPKVEKFTFPNIDAPLALGNSNVQINNVPNANYNAVFSLGAGGGASSSDNSINNVISTAVIQNKTPDDMLISFFPGSGDPSYQWIKGAETGKNYSVNLNEFKKFTPHTITTPNNNYTFLTIKSFQNNSSADGYYIYTPNFTQPGPTLTAYTVDELTEYQTNFVIFDGNQTYVVNRIGDIPSSISTPPISIAFLDTDASNYSIQISGDYDYANIYFTGKNLTNQVLSWEVIVPKKTTLVGSVPIIPQVITTALPFVSNDNIKMGSVKIVASEQITDYDDYILNSFLSYTDDRYNNYLVTKVTN